MTANVGKNNAYTTDDYTYYYEVFPSKNLELGLWLEPEQMIKAINRREVQIKHVKSAEGRILLTANKLQLSLSVLPLLRL